MIEDAVMAIYLYEESLTSRFGKLYHRRDYNKEPLLDCLVYHSLLVACIWVFIAAYFFIDGRLFSPWLDTMSSL